VVNYCTIDLAQDCAKVLFLSVEEGASLNAGGLLFVPEVKLTYYTILAVQRGCFTLSTTVVAE
jgi:hypothetical protein